eukprot:2792274-Karenia_brevis.AAC.1
MGKKYERLLKKGVIIDASRRGRPTSQPDRCIQAWCKFNRPATNVAERLAEVKVAEGQAAVKVAEGVALTRQDMFDAGALLLRGSKCADVVLSHILHRECHPQYDAADSFYNMIVP